MFRFAQLIRIIIVLLLVLPQLYSQKPPRDKGVFVEPKNEFWDEIKNGIDEYKKKDDKKELKYKLDFSSYNLPKSIEEFKCQWYNEPIPQGATGTCWCFCTTSLLESELFRIHGKKQKFSEMYSVYWEYLEKARRFIRERGESYFSEGSESNGLTRIWKIYGCVPAESYTGMKPGQKFHDHGAMVQELNTYLESVKKSCFWNEESALANIRTILNHYLGEPPAAVTIGSKTMTPLEYLRDEVRLNPDDYVDIMSLMEKPYWTKTEYTVPDNWWHDSSYHNVPLDDYMKTLKDVVKKGYTVAIGGDVSEAGYESHVQAAVVPTFDIPAEYIDENARQFRFSNHTTTDDHGIHIVGYKETNGEFWFLIKDSGSGARNGTNKGFYFYHENYIKLKMMSFMVHRSAVQDLLKKLK